MESSNEILTELQEIAPFLSKSAISTIPYAVPSGYFDGFSEKLINRLRSEGTGFSKSAEFEIAEISPLLAGIQKKNPYRVPDGFFENLQARISNSETAHSKLQAMPVVESDSKQAPARRVSAVIQFIRYAAVACFVGLIGVALFNTGNHKDSIDPIQGLTNISDQDMADFMDSEDVHWTPGITSTSEIASIDFSDNDIHELLNSVPDAELEQYADALQVGTRSVN